MIDGEFGRVAALVSRSLCSAPGWIERPAPLRGVGFGAGSGSPSCPNSAMPPTPLVAGVALVRRPRAASRLLLLAIGVPTPDCAQTAKGVRTSIYRFALILGIEHLEFMSFQDLKPIAAIDGLLLIEP